MQGHFQCATAQVASETLAGAWGFSYYASSYLPLAILYGITFLMALVLLALLRRRDPV